MALVESNRFGGRSERLTGTESKGEIAPRGSFFFFKRRNTGKTINKKVRNFLQHLLFLS